MKLKITAWTYDQQESRVTLNFFSIHTTFHSAATCCIFDLICYDLLRISLPKKSRFLIERISHHFVVFVILKF